jgi:hypothetical protein
VACPSAPPHRELSGRTIGDDQVIGDDRPSRSSVGTISMRRGIGALRLATSAAGSGNVASLGA